MPNSKYETSGGASSLGSPVRADTVSESTTKETNETGKARAGSIHQLHAANSLPCSTQSSQFLPDGDRARVSNANSGDCPPDTSRMSDETRDNDDFVRKCAPVGAQRTYGAVNVRIVSMAHRECYTKRVLRLKVGYKYYSASEKRR